MASLVTVDVVLVGFVAVDLVPWSIYKVKMAKKSMKVEMCKPTEPEAILLVANMISKLMPMPSMASTSAATSVDGAFIPLSLQSRDA